MKYRLLIAFAFITSFSIAQSKEGYWDNVRTTNETIHLKAGERKYIKSADLPVGTTEVVYRITLLDDNQKISSSLVSILKSIPDPTGISQGSAGAIFLASTITGDDKCKYALFTSATDADNYIKTSKAVNACVVQDTPVNKEAKLLSTTSKCLDNNAKNIWFAFQSDNWVMNQKVVLEVVPWIDNKLSSGWNADTKKELLNICNNFPLTKSITKKDLFCGYFLEGVTQRYSYKQFSSLLAVEKIKLYNEVSEQALIKTGDKNALVTIARNNISQLLASNKKQEAINLLQTEIIDKGQATAADYNTVASFYLFSKQFDKAKKFLDAGIQKDSIDLNLQLTLAHWYLFNNELSAAKDIHRKYQLQNINATTTWVQQTKADFKQFEKLGFPTDDFKKILRIFGEN